MERLTQVSQLPRVLINPTDSLAGAMSQGVLSGQLFSQESVGRATEVIEQKGDESDSSELGGTAPPQRW